MPDVRKMTNAELLTEAAKSRARDIDHAQGMMARAELSRRIAIMEEFGDAAIAKSTAQVDCIADRIGPHEFYERHRKYDATLDAYRAMKGEQ